MKLNILVPLILFAIMFVTVHSLSRLFSVSKYKFNSKHMCAKPEFCLSKLPRHRHSLKAYLENYARACSCKGVFSYACGKDYCSISKQTCDEMHKNNLENLIIYQINGCI